MTGCHSPQSPDLAWKNRAAAADPASPVQRTSLEQTNASKGKHRTNCYIDACCAKKFYFLFSNVVTFPISKAQAEPSFVVKRGKSNSEPSSFTWEERRKPLGSPWWPSIAPAWEIAGASGSGLTTQYRREMLLASAFTLSGGSKCQGKKHV